jgi:antitoxin CptB
MEDINSKDSENVRLRRIRYRSWHRGCKETDEVLGNFADKALGSLKSEIELDLYEKLLDEQDVNIWDWLTDKTQLADGKYDCLKERLLVFAKAS